MSEEADLLALNDAIFDELLLHRMIVIASAAVLSKAEASNELPVSLVGRFTALEMSSIGLYLNEMQISNAVASSLLQLMGPSEVSSSSHYERISALHLSSAQLGAEAQAALLQLLTVGSCALRMLDLSYTSVDGAALAQGLAQNTSLTSIDLRKVSKMEDSYGAIGEILLPPESTCRLAYLRCDAFELLEGEVTLSLRERPVGCGAIRLLSGLLTNNRSLEELDLTATNLEPEWALMLLELIKGQRVRLTSIHMRYVKRDLLIMAQCQKRPTYYSSKSKETCLSWLTCVYVVVTVELTDSTQLSRL